jgi:hypothetical protein
MTDNGLSIATFMYDDTSSFTSEGRTFAAHPGRMSGPIMASPRASVISLNSTSADFVREPPHAFGATIDPTGGALLLRVPEELKSDNSKWGQTTQFGNDKLGTTTFPEPQWSSGNQIVRTLRPVSSAPSPLNLPQAKQRPTVLSSAHEKRELSGSSHYIKTSDRLAQEEDKELSKKGSSNSFQSLTTKAKISAPIPQHQPNTGIFLRDSPDSEFFPDDEDAYNTPFGRSVDNPRRGWF